jgi:hypothetical protein
MLNTFSKLIKSLIDKHAPIIKVKIKHKSAPCINTNITKQIHLRNKLKRKLKNNFNLQNVRNYNIVKKQIKCNIDTGKQNFITKCLEKHSTKVVWNVINRLFKPQNIHFQHDINNLNTYFIETSERVLGEKYY